MSIIRNYYNKPLSGLRADELSSGDIANIINDITKTCPGRDVSKVSPQMVSDAAEAASTELVFNTDFWGTNLDGKKQMLLKKTKEIICSKLPIVNNNPNGNNPIPAPQEQPSGSDSWASDDKTKYYIIGGIGIVAIVGGAWYLKKSAKPNRRKKK